MLSTLLALALLPQSADVTLLAASPGQFGDVLVADPMGIDAPERPDRLRGLRLLELDVSGRMTLETWLPGRAQRVDDLGPAASRLVLPGGRGSLYHYERRSTDFRGCRFGFFRVDRDGRAQYLWERLGVGPSADVNPFLSTLGLDRTGRSALLASSPAAGGNLYELDLETGDVSLRTPDLAPLEFDPDGLRLSSAWGAAVSSSGVVRFDRAPGASAEWLSWPASAPTSFQGDLVLSEDGSTMATSAGASSQLRDVYTFGASGPAHRVSTVPGSVSGAGFANQTNAGPYLALAPDGSKCAWTTTGISRELFVRSATVGAPAPDQVSADAHFLDTLDEISSIRFLPNGDFTFLLGELEAPEGTLDNGEMYLGSVDPVSGTTTLTNVTGTSGDLADPFLAAGTLKTEGGIFALDGLNGYFLHDDQSSNTGAMRVLRVGTPGVTTLLGNVAELEAVSVSGDFACCLLERNLPGSPREFWSYDLQANFASRRLGVVPGFQPLVALRPSGVGEFAYVRSGLSGRQLGRLNASLGTQIELGGPGLPLQDAVEWSSASGLVSSANVGGVGYAAVWPGSGAPALLAAEVGGLLVLPGR